MTSYSVRVVLCCLMTPGLSKDDRCHVRPYFGSYIFKKCFKTHQITETSYSVRVGLGLGCLMTPGLSRDIRCHVWPYFISEIFKKCLETHQITVTSYSVRVGFGLATCMTILILNLGAYKTPDQTSGHT